MLIRERVLVNTGGLGNVPLPEVFDRQRFDNLCRFRTEHQGCLMACGIEIRFSSTALLCNELRQQVHLLLLI